MRPEKTGKSPCLLHQRHPPGPDPEKGLVDVKLTSLSEDWLKQSWPWTTEYQEAIVFGEHYMTCTNAQNIMLGEEYLSVRTI